MAIWTIIGQSMRLVLVSVDPDVVKEAQQAFDKMADLVVVADWRKGLDLCQDADMLFVDMLATLNEPHKIAGYEVFAQAKMSHDVAKDTPLVLIGPHPDYQLDFVVGWDGFLFSRLQRPVTWKMLLRITTYL